MQYIHRKKGLQQISKHTTLTRELLHVDGATPVQVDQMKHLQNCQHLKSSPRHQIAEEDAKVNLSSFSVMPQTPSLEEVACLSVCLFTLFIKVIVWVRLLVDGQTPKSPCQLSCMM
jgi:hypothetical protein